MTRRYSSYAAMAAVLMLAGCNDDDAGTPAPTPTPTSSPTPASSPTPSPTPAPTPSPSPTSTPTTASYDVAPDLTRDRRWIGNDVLDAAVNGSGDRVSYTLSGSDDAVTTFTSATGTFTIAGFEDLPGGPTFGPGPGFTLYRDMTNYAYESDTVEVGFQFAPARFRYVMAAYYIGPTRYRVSAIGAPTAPADLTRFSSRTYLAVIDEDAADPTPLKARAMTVDLAARTVSGTVLKIDDPDVEVTLTGTIDPTTNRITGQLTARGGAWTGAFRGRLYGPDAQEIALIMTISRDGAVYPSTLVGSLQTASSR